MKTDQFDYYTDKILFEEGFFKNEQEEKTFLDKIGRSVETAIIEYKAVAKGTIVPKNYTIVIKKINRK